MGLLESPFFCLVICNHRCPQCGATHHHGKVSNDDDRSYLLGNICFQFRMRNFNHSPARGYFVAWTAWRSTTIAHPLWGYSFQQRFFDLVSAHPLSRTTRCQPHREKPRSAIIPSGATLLSAGANKWWLIVHPTAGLSFTPISPEHPSRRSSLVGNPVRLLL